MTDYIWTELRDPFIAKTGSAPSAELEERVIQVFMADPLIVVAGMQSIAERHARGLVRSPWPVLAMHCEEARETQSRGAGLHASDSSSREKLIVWAEKWVRLTGVHFVSAEEVEDELFGYHGILRDFGEEPGLVERMLALWAQERPRGETVEREELERAERQKRIWELEEQRKKQRQQQAEAETLAALEEMTDPDPSASQPIPPTDGNAGGNTAQVVRVEPPREPPRAPLSLDQFKTP